MTSRPANGALLGPRPIVLARSRADRAYRALSTGAGLLTLVILALIGLFLALQSLPAFRQMGLAFFATQKWQPDTTHQFGVAAVLYWTAVIAAIALAIAIVVSLPCALYITEYAPRRLRRALMGLVDLLAAIPSVIYGIWGLAFLEPHVVSVSAWLATNLGFIPIFQSTRSNYAGSALIAALVVSIMIMPICTSVMREVFSQTPPGEKEAALALGATRWSMIRAVVIPFGRGGIIGGAMLGLGRALGETIAVSLIISPIFLINVHWVQSGANSIAAMIALLFGEATRQYGIPALMAAGLTLFVVTLLVNFLASLIVARSRSGKGVEI
jgi:phosphate transport system permease protein